MFPKEKQHVLLRNGNVTVIERSIHIDHIRTNMKRIEIVISMSSF